MQLGFKNTPLHRLGRLTDLWGGELWVKRDDLTGSGFSGNKVRKLEYFMEDAISSGADTVITCGGVQSNHCRATALISARLGLQCALLLRGSEPEEFTGNLLLDKLAGARVKYLTDQQYYWGIKKEVESIQDAVGRAGSKAYFIPEGGSNYLGALGFVDAMKELKGQCEEAGVKPSRILCATGSGGTHAGLLAGAKILKWDVDVVTVGVCYNHTESVQRVFEIIEELKVKRDLDLGITLEDVHVLDDYRGPGYGIANDDIYDVIHQAAHFEGVLVDPVYTGKTLWAISDQIKRKLFDGTTLFWHTGGMFGLFPHAEQLTKFLKSDRVIQS